MVRSPANPAWSDTEGMTTPRPLTALPSAPLTDGYWRERGSFLARLYAAHGPVVRATLGRAEVVFLLGPAANRVVLQTHRRCFAQHDAWDWVFGRPSSPPNLLTMDDPEHAWHRRVLHPAFAVRRMDDYLPLIVRAIDRRLATWAARGVVDIYEEARVITFDVVAEALLGLRGPADLALCRAVYLHGAHWRADEFAGLLRRAVAERRACPGGDALGLLAKERDEQGCPLDDAQILAHADVLLIAGHETSASLAAWALYLLVEHPVYERRVLDELDRYAPGQALTAAALRGMETLDRALSEAERLYPPGTYRAARGGRGHGVWRLRAADGDARVLLRRRHARPARRLVAPDPLRPGPLRASPRGAPARAIRSSRLRGRPTRLHRPVRGASRAGPVRGARLAAVPPYTGARPDGRAARWSHQPAPPRYPHARPAAVTLTPNPSPARGRGELRGRVTPCRSATRHTRTALTPPYAAAPS